MSIRTKIYRFGTGFVLVAAILGVTFSALPGWIHNWGAQPDEIGRVYPGDELIPHPYIDWTHGMTIDAPKEKVWQWVAQIGDKKAGFYSYTFIENIVAQGSVTYKNANEIIPAYQNPKPGEEIILSTLEVREVKPGEWLLADTHDTSWWTWLWKINAIHENQTRLVVKMRIQLPEDMPANPVTDFFLDSGGFVMERRMMQGIKDRAEGRVDPPYSEALEIGLWVITLLIGLGAAVLFVFSPAWKFALGLGVVAVVFLNSLTFLQPVIWMRLIMVAFLAAGLALAIWKIKKLKVSQ